MKNVIVFLTLLFTGLFSFGQLTIAQAAQDSIFDTASTLFSNDDEFLKVDEAFVFDFYQKGNKLELSFNVKDGYYLYQHQFKFSTENATTSAINLPKGIEHNDEYFGLQEIYLTPLTLMINIEQASENASLTVRYQGCAKKGLCYPPTSKKIPLDQVMASLAKSEKTTEVPQANANANDILSGLAASDDSAKNSPATESTNLNNAGQSEQFELADMLAGDSLVVTLIAFFILGLGLSFTPCVFPMYPILTGIIVGQGKSLSNKKAFSLSFFYVQGMAITYTILGIVVALAGAQFQAMFQHPAVLITLSILFIFLALSMFGAFNLALPSSWQNKLNNLSNSQKGGSIFGVMAMGAISGLVASPCTTAPLTGALIFIAESGDILTGAAALYTLSLGMGLPLLVLGSSGGKILPKAGNWMNIIKNIFGLLLLAVPIFLLERFIPELAAQILWALLAIAAGSYFYLANSQTDKTLFHGVRFALIFILLFFGANKLYQTVFPPMMHAPAVELNSFVPVDNLAQLREEVNKANQAGKTVMVDLYADWCIACKEFEHLTFPKPNVQKALSNTVLLQVDLTETGSTASIELMAEFDVFGLPSILFFDLQGNELINKRVTGFMAADEFTQHLNSFL
ncbi:MAG: protein-disulfide reductase DsbD [Thalassotalea sp.]